VVNSPKSSIAFIGRRFRYHPCVAFDSFSFFFAHLLCCFCFVFNCITSIHWRAGGCHHVYLHCRTSAIRLSFVMCFKIAYRCC
jgi:hypothetical protein